MLLSAVEKSGKVKTKLISAGIDDDEDVRAGLTWLAVASGNPKAFAERLARAQQAYRAIIRSLENFGQDPSLEIISEDVVGTFLAQAKSLLDDRHSYDIALAPQIVPWVKQIGRSVGVLPFIPGAVERAARMLKAGSVTPDSAMFELVMASNYAADGFDVAFVEEAAGQARTPDLRLSVPGFSEPIFVECKRLKCGQYEIKEQARHRKLFESAADLMHGCRLSVHLDVTYTQELADVPDSYLAERLMGSLSSSINPTGYSWKDEFGFGTVMHADLDAVRLDIRDTTLYIGTKLARLLCGHAVREGGYHLAPGVKLDARDPRFIDSIQYGSVVTWQCIAPTAIEKKARFVKARVVEADRQLTKHGSGIAHLAMDMELKCGSSDLRRARNIEAIKSFRPASHLLAIYLHYLVPRISETHAWIIDETVDRFGLGSDDVPLQMVFPASVTIGNELPAWKQEI